MDGDRPHVTVSTDASRLVRQVSRAMESGLEAAGAHGVRAVRGELGGPSPSPPGAAPGRVEGDLIRAVASGVAAGPEAVSMWVGVPRTSPEYPKAVRLARGFVGTDAAGRTYAQAGRPFVGPVMARERRRLAQIIEDEASQHAPHAKRSTT